MAEPLPAVDWFEAITADSGALVVAARTAGAGADLPHCPGWTVTELLEHVGSVLYRASLIIGDRRERRPHRSETTAPPGDPFRWFEQGRAAILPVLRSADPAASYWTFTGPKPLRWWLRRLANETCVHRVDAEQAAGAPVVVQASLAVDGIDEKLETYLPVLASGQHREPPGTVLLHAVDLDVAWTVSVGDEVTVERAAAAADAAVTAAAADLYLWLWERASDDLVAVDGAISAVETLRAAARV